MSTKNVVVFSTPTCPWCIKLKQYLRERKISFSDKDVSRDNAAAEAMIRKTGQQGVPQVWIDNVPVVGFNKEKIEQLLSK